MVSQQMRLLLFTQLLNLIVTTETTSTDSMSKRGAMSNTQQQGASALCRGLPGLPGRDGRDGRDATLVGPPGKRGDPGPKGAQGIKGDSGGVTGGAVYTRWGRKDCPKSHNTSMLYSGVMGGSHYTHSGGGSNYLCLPMDPIFERTTSGFQGYSYIYGTEYEINKQANILPKDLHDHDALCAVCHTESRGSHMMIPARNVCPSGWTMEYKGYLMSDHHSHKGRTQFICVDGNAEGNCGSLPCPPYANGKELTCAVCTK